MPLTLVYIISLITDEMPTGKSKVKHQLLKFLANIIYLYRENGIGLISLSTE